MSQIYSKLVVYYIYTDEKDTKVIKNDEGLYQFMRELSSKNIVKLQWQQIRFLDKITAPCLTTF